jgi:hypothetical protein
MASWIFVLAAAAAGGEQDSTGSAQRGIHEFPLRISELLKQESQAKNNATRAAAACALCELHGQIVRDPRYATSDALKEYRGRLWSRLTKIKGELKQQLGRNKATRSTLDDLAILEAADSASVSAADSLAESLAILDQTQGGPGQLLAFGGAAVRTDWGPELVDLIERTINPSFWDVVGGPGTIVYYRPLQCLVVRATAEVHGNVGGVIGNLRRAGP